MKKKRDCPIIEEMEKGMEKTEEKKVVMTEEQFWLIHSFIHAMDCHVSREVLMTALGLCLCPSCPKAGECEVRNMFMEVAKDLKGEAEILVSGLTGGQSGGA